jgi:hypothetical protein
MTVNGRLSGLLPLDRASIERAAGNVAFEAADADDGGAFDAAHRWATSGGAYVRRVPVSDYYDDAASPFTLTLLGGTVSVGKDAQGRYLLTVRADGPAGAHAISAPLG